MNTVEVSVTDGRYIQGYPNAIIVRGGYKVRFYVTPDDWNKYTGGVSINKFERGQEFTLTQELFDTLKGVAIQKPKETKSVIATSQKDNTCPRCD